jgi:Tol biopolymer transport system component
LDRKLKAPPGLPWPVPIAWLPDPDRVLFAATLGDSTNLWEAPFSGETAGITGEPVRSTFGTGIEIHAAFSAAPAKLVYSALNLNVDVWTLPVDVNQGRVTGAMQRLTEDATFDGSPAVSLDGRRLIMASQRDGNWGLWFRDMNAGSDRLLAMPRFQSMYPRISGDGSRVVFEQSSHEVYTITLPAVSPEKLCSACGHPTHVSRTGDKVLLEFPNPNDHVRLWDAASKNLSPVLQAPRDRPNAAPFSARFSPDDKWISFHTLSSASTRRVFVAPFAGSGTIDSAKWIPVTDGNTLDREAYWSPDGRLLYFLSDRDGFRCIWAQRLDPDTKRPAGAAFTVHHLHHAKRSIANVGQSPAAVGLSVAEGKLIFALGELTGHIFMSSQEPNQ